MKNSVSGVTIDATSTSPLKSSWGIVSTCGGRFKSKSIFSRDEKYCLLTQMLTSFRYLFVATEKVLKVLSTKSGQCVRSIGSIQGKGRIVDFAIDPFNDFRLLIAYDSSIIRAYDWTDGLFITVTSLQAETLTAD